MSLRPRYSLLTLLVLTALVAGGVKLWYGPHHVVERPTQHAENEFTYTRSLSGEKVINGVHVFRQFESEQTSRGLRITYYRQGEPLPWYFECSEVPKDYANRLASFCDPPASPLAHAEELVFQKVIEREKQHMFPGKNLLETTDNQSRQIFEILPYFPPIQD